MTSTTQLAPPDLAGFMADRLGMFIHFGLYALAGRHEWVQNRERITPEEYRRYFAHFDPDLFDAADWARRWGGGRGMGQTPWGRFAPAALPDLRGRCA